MTARTSTPAAASRTNDPAPAPAADNRDAAARSALPSPATTDSPATAQAPPEAAAETAAAPAPVPNQDDEFWPAKPNKSGAFTIQVGSTRSEAEAKEQVANYLNQGFADAYCYKTKTGRYNIRIGRFETEEESRRAAEALAAAGAVKPYISKLNI
ncbi:MAG: SPOR domain-containing protein [Deltaproteobacteria bacterium]|nr:SPOR domain-containing protein [Deltaproteobacteria bacterium]